MHTHTTVPIEGDDHDKRAMKVLASQYGYKTLGQFTRAAIVKAFGKELLPMAKKFREDGEKLLQIGDRN